MSGTTLLSEPLRSMASGLSSSSVGTLSAHSSSVLHACQPCGARQRTSSEKRHTAGAWYRSGSRPGTLV